MVALKIQILVRRRAVVAAVVANLARGAHDLALLDGVLGSEKGIEAVLQTDDAAGTVVNDARGAADGEGEGDFKVAEALAQGGVLSRSDGNTIVVKDSGADSAVRVQREAEMARGAAAALSVANRAGRDDLDHRGLTGLDGGSHGQSGQGKGDDGLHCIEC